MIVNSFIAANDYKFGAQMTLRPSCFLVDKHNKQTLKAFSFSLPVPPSRVAFRVLLSRENSRLRQMESLLAG